MINHELDLIGAGMINPAVAVSSKVSGKHFNDPTLGSAWDAIVAIAADQLQPEPTLIVQKLRLSGERAREVAAAMVEAYTTSIEANHEAYAAAVLDGYDRERLRMAAIRALSMLDSEEPAEKIRGVFSAVADVESEDELAASLLTADEFVDQEIPPAHWIIPDMLAAGDRLMLTGWEGSGKSMLQRQIGMCVAAGVHPFSRRPIVSSRVLVVDAENPLGIMVSKFAGLRDALRMGGFETRDRLFVHRQPAGLDLTTPQGRAHLRALCRTVSPDLLIIGPIYKLYVPNESRDEVHARQVAAVLDELRAEHNLAVITEHHTPMENGGSKRQIRPVGTGLWLRWPEFGFGLVPQDGTEVEDRQMNLVPWRGSRDEREWPKRLQGAGGAPGRLPWLDEDDLGHPWHAGMPGSRKLSLV